MNKTFKFILFIIVVLLIGYGIFHFTKTKEVASPVSTNQNTGVKEFDLKVENRKLIEGPAVMSVEEGDTVSIHITADEDEEFHLHGYDRSVNLTSGTESILEFVADTSGRFPAELENSKTDIVTLEVSPK